MENYFYLEISPIYKNKYVLRYNVEKYPFKLNNGGSYMVLPARLLGLSYSDYLRFIRDRLGAELIGKNARIITPYFDKTPEVKLLVDLLNSRMRFAIFAHEHPYDLKEDENGNIIKIPFKQDENNT